MINRKFVYLPYGNNVMLLTYTLRRCFISDNVFNSLSSELFLSYETIFYLSTPFMFTTIKKLFAKPECFCVKTNICV